MEFVDDYVPLTSECSFRVAASAQHGGKALVANEELAAGTELLEELPLVAWPMPAAASAGDFCDACLSVTSGELAHCGCGRHRRINTGSLGVGRRRGRVL